MKRQMSQVSKLNETYLVEVKRELQKEGGYHGGIHLKVFSNIMKKETHVVDNVSEHEGICQVLFEAIEGQSEVCGKVEEAISGLSKSNQ